MAFMFEKLEVYQKAIDFADEIAGMTGGFPRGYGFLADQLNRAALSIATNLAEGNGRFTRPDRRNFFTIGRGSGQESVPTANASNHARRGTHSPAAPWATLHAFRIAGRIRKGTGSRDTDKD
jgi:four helix bundle protein